MIDEGTIGVKRYKCFGTTSVAIPSLRRVNMIVGRNNSGKSALLDVIAYTCGTTGSIGPPNIGEDAPEVIITRPLSDDLVRQRFHDNTKQGASGFQHWSTSQQWGGTTLEYVLSNPRRFLSLTPALLPNPMIPGDYGAQLAQALPPPLEGRSFARLLAERDIKPEPAENNNMELRPNGDQFTTIIQTYLNDARYSSDLIELNLLAELNQVFAPDARFSRILSQRDATKHWEIYLEEPHKGKIALSRSGSGLKTVLLVLAMLHLKPIIEGRAISDYLFAFEELENNLHPAVQRRLLAYIDTFTKAHSAVAIATTHSPVAIDMFAAREDAQILHISGAYQQVSVRRVTTYIEHDGILDDLDIRASDLLQANGIVWVEGPSDRLYFNRWVDLFSGGSLREGTHYQCVFYGGRLLAHLDARDPARDDSDLVSIFGVNRNAILLIDSDKREAGDAINATKRRLVDEIKQLKGMSWVTAGREVENYIPGTTIASAFELTDASTVGSMDDFADYLNSTLNRAGALYTRSKVMFAEKVIPHLTVSGLSAIMDLSQKAGAAVEEIRNWNRLPPPAQT